MTQGDWIGVTIIVAVFLVSSIAAVASTSKGAKNDAAVVTVALQPLAIGGVTGSAATVEVTNGGNRTIHNVTVRLDGAGSFTDGYGTSAIRNTPARESQHWTFPVGDLRTWMDSAEKTSPVVTWSDNNDRRWQCDRNGVHRL